MGMPFRFDDDVFTASRKLAIIETQVRRKAREIARRAQSDFTVDLTQTFDKLMEEDDEIDPKLLLAAIYLVAKRRIRMLLPIERALPAGMVLSRISRLSARMIEVGNQMVRLDFARDIFRIKYGDCGGKFEAICFDALEDCGPVDACLSVPLDADEFPAWETSLMDDEAGREQVTGSGVINGEQPHDRQSGDCADEQGRTA